jgi:hypothetical protein
LFVVAADGVSGSGVWADYWDEYQDSVAGEEFGDIADSGAVAFAVGFGEAEVAGDGGAQVVPVEDGDLYCARES